ncbi:MAG: ABC transporter ATP-binding protein, partial [Clostridia bacterium]|nr:ABC transporter ATP-binding protein [Clostridia bacterium]
MPKSIEIKNITMKYHDLSGETKAIDNLSLSVNQGEFISIVGPSGCGKSTLLSLVAGLIKPSSGEIKIFGDPVETNCSKIGYMFQHDHLFPWRTIIQNAMLGLEIQHKNNKKDLAKIERLLKTYGLEEFKNAYPYQLSGGMRQRAALIRTLALEPEIFLLDEPFSALDYQTRLAIADEVYTILKNRGKTILFVTHDIAEAISMADRVVVLTNRPAKIKSIHQIAFSCADRSPLKCRD